jgi:cytochrome oxidase Cu insertion factor (SCO1/SenC/PrrC family)
VAAWLAYFVWQPESRANYGELIEPQQLRDPELRLLDGRPFRLSQLRGKWVMLHIDSGACAEECRKKLVYMRQARLAQGKAMNRVERVWLLTDAVAPEDALVHEFEGTRIARAEGSHVLAEFPVARSRTDHIYVVDPLGNLMLRFPADPDPRRIVKDLARLLRVSRIG